MNEFLSDIINEKRSSENHYSLDNEVPPRVTIRSLTKSLSGMLVGLLLGAEFTTLCFFSTHWQWALISTNNRVAMAVFDLVSIVTIFTNIPQRIVLTPGSETVVYFWGIYSFSLRFIVPVGQIKGIYVANLPFGKGTVVPCLGISWNTPFKPFIFSRSFPFARFSDDTTTLTWAKEISEATGLPIDKVSLKR